MAFGGHNDDAKHQDTDCNRKIEHMLPGKANRRTRYDPLQLAKGNKRAGEGNRTNGNTKAHFNQAGRPDIARRANAIGPRRIKGGGGNKHRCQTHQRVEGGNKLRQCRHLDLERDDRTNGPAKQNADNDGGI